MEATHKDNWMDTLRTLRNEAEIEMRDDYAGATEAVHDLRLLAGRVMRNLGGLRVPADADQEAWDVRCQQVRRMLARCRESRRRWEALCAVLNELSK